MYKLAITVALLALVGCGTSNLPQSKFSVEDYLAKIEPKTDTCPWDYKGNPVPLYTGTFFPTLGSANRAIQGFVSSIEVDTKPKLETRCIGPLFKEDSFTVNNRRYALLRGSDHSANEIVSATVELQGAGPQSWFIVPLDEYEKDGLVIQRGLNLSWNSGRVVDQRGGTTKLIATNGIWYTHSDAEANRVEKLREQGMPVAMPREGWIQSKKAELLKLWLLDENQSQDNIFGVGIISPDGEVKTGPIAYVIVGKYY